MSNNRKHSVALAIHPKKIEKMIKKVKLYISEGVDASPMVCL